MKIERIEQLKQDYKDCIIKYRDFNGTDLDEILLNSDGSIKFWNCINIENAENNILWASINPSNNGDTRERDFNMRWSDVNWSGHYWSCFKRRIGDDDSQLRNICGHMDLLPIAITCQKDISKKFFTKEDTPQRKFAATLLRISQEFIEELCPKLIVYSNCSSSFLWGFNEKHPWMGYSFEATSINSKISRGRYSEKPKSSFFKFNGIRNSFYGKTETNLQEKYFLLDYQVGGRQEDKKKSIQFSDILEIWDEINRK